MLAIRLQRVGKKNEPTFRIVVTESQNGPKSGRFLEILGNYDARDKNETRINNERVLHWISNGAQVSDTLHNLFIEKGVIEGKKVNALPKKTPVVKEEAPKEEAAAPAPEATKGDAPKEEVKTEETPVEVTEAPAVLEAETPVEAPEEKAEEAPVEEKTAE